MADKSPVAVAFSINDGYLNPFLVSLVALFTHAEVQTEYAIYVVNYQLSASARQKTQALVNKWHPRSSLTFLDVSAEQWAQTPFVGTWHKEASYRLFLPELVPHLKQIIYLDGDTVAQCDLTMLYELNLQGKAFAGVRDELWDGSMRAQQRLHYFSQQEGATTQNYMTHSAYCNSGVLVMNLEFFRQHNFTAKALALLNKYKNTPGMLPDQDVLNYLATCEGQDNICFLPAVFNWNLSAATLAPEATEYERMSWAGLVQRRNEWVTDKGLLAISEPQILHFSGKPPWEEVSRQKKAFYQDYADKIEWTLPNKFSVVKFRLLGWRRWGKRERILAVVCFYLGLLSVFLGLILVLFLMTDLIK